MISSFYAILVLLLVSFAVACYQMTYEDHLTHYPQYSRWGAAATLGLREGMYTRDQIANAYKKTVRKLNHTRGKKVPHHNDELGRIRGATNTMNKIRRRADGVKNVDSPDLDLLFRIPGRDAPRTWSEWFFGTD